MGSSRSWHWHWHLAIAFAVIGLMILAIPAASITYGQPDAGHPQVGAILVLYQGNWYEFCSGTLVASRVFLTAGHCTDALAAFGFGPSDIRLSFSQDLFGRKAT